jgi:hypothetical protein
MGTKPAPANHPWAGHHLNQLSEGFASVVQNPDVRLWADRLSNPMVYLVGGMLGFIVAVDGYVLMRTM